jgi:Xaa-Pro aminopeptidase
MSDRRDFLKTTAAAALGVAVASGCAPKQQERPARTGGSENLLVKSPDHPEPATLDRLPLEWYQKTVQRLQQKLTERGLDGIFINDRWNIIYFTGLFHSSTERPFACFIPAKALEVHWFHPGLDRDLVDSWWKTSADYYFDFQHAPGGFPNKGEVATGDKVDLLEWMLKGIEKLGYGNKKIALDHEPSVNAMKRMTDVLPKARFESVGDICMKMRMVKTAEEIALAQRAMNYWSRIHAFARDYILEHGTGATDFEVGMAATQWGTDLVMKDIRRDGKPHNAVGISVSVSCRTGVGTAYPHPNQFHHSRISKGDALQVSGVVRVGGHGGELYRAYQIAPWTPEQEKMWEVQNECILIQARESKAGVRCRDVAKVIHDYQVKMGMAEYIYHRPAHGEGMEGHQAPYIALGDDTVLEEGMMFSVEPGLYNPKGGYGYNPSDNLLVAKDKGVLMGSVPTSKEWSFLTL